MRTHRDLPIFGCLSCRSFSNPSGYVEDEAQLARDLEWHKSVAERNAKASLVLLTALRDANVDISRIIEIGAGTGTLLHVAGKEFGATGIGYEVNPFTQPYALTANAVDVRAEFWTSKTQTGPFSLMLCIMVLEHIPKPRPLMQEMVDACLRENASLFISVPFIDRDRWHFLFENNPRAAGNPFFDQDVHVTHFSSAALEDVLKSFGMGRITWIRKGLWHGVLARP